MENSRPRGRERNVNGPGKTVQKRGDGLGTGPVGSADGYRDRRQSGGRAQVQGGRREQGHPPGMRSAGTKSGSGMKLIILVLILLLGGGGGGLTAFLNGQPDSQTPSSGQQSGNTGTIGNQGNSGTQGSSGNHGNLGSTDWAALLSGLGGGSVSAGWQTEANTGRLDTSVASGSREKYTKLLGDGKDSVTVMVYMCGTDLESHNGMGTADLQEMLDARFGSSLNLLVYTGGCKAWKNNEISSSSNQIWQIKNGKIINLQKDLGSVSMTDPHTLSGYITWCAENYPANRYELILWDHGGGSVSGYGYDEKFASSGSMSLAGLDSALKSAGVTFDFIGFDACLMATVETALTMSQYADYLIASEETEPGVGWYYTDWLTALGENTSMPTIQIGQNIADSFVDTCAQKCRGQLTTLSVTDLAELEHTLPKALNAFSNAMAGLIRNQQYQTVSNARSDTREFAQSSKIDQVDLVHLAQNLNTQEGEKLIDVLLGAVKYNRTSSNMTNAYGLSIYFPYRKSSMVNRAVSTFEQIGMDSAYTRCIRQFADVTASGQAAAGGSDSPLPALLGMLGGNTGSSTADIASLLEGILGGRSLDMENAEEYLTKHRFADESLVWNTGADGMPVLYLSEEQWGLVQTLELNMFYDDGEGYIDLGLDNVYEFDDAGGLLGRNDAAWLAINGQPVAYYHTSTVDDGEHYTITGRVPVLHNGSRAELILAFTDEQPYGFAAGVQTVYTEGETDTIAKSITGLQSGDILEFLCDYYSYSGEYEDSYLLGEPLTVTEEELTISDVPLAGTTRASYRFTDLYDKHHWTPVIPETH